MTQAPPPASPAAGACVRPCWRRAYSEGSARKGKIRHEGVYVAPLEHPGVQALVAEFHEVEEGTPQAEIARRTARTINDIVDKLEDAFQAAKAAENPNGMVAAAMGQAKVLGLIVHHTSAAIMRANQLRLWFTAIAYVLLAALRRIALAGTPLLFPARQAGWRIATFYMFAALGMALGGWMGGFIFDIWGSYAYAFLAAFGFNVMNFCTIAIIYLRQIRLGLSPLPA